jgi:hypothetical protein
MIESSVFKAISELGIGAFCVAAGSWMLWYLIKQTIVRTMSLMDKLVDKMDKLDDKMIRHEDMTSERAKYVREEHKQMIETLGRINGYKK